MIKISLGSCAPLDDYEEWEIPEETVKKDYLWDKLIPEKEEKNHKFLTVF